MKLNIRKGRFHLVLRIPNRLALRILARSIKGGNGAPCLTVEQIVRISAQLRVFRKQHPDEKLVQIESRDLQCIISP